MSFTAALEHRLGQLALEVPVQASILGVGTSVPEHVWTQRETLEKLAQHFPIYQNHRVQKLFENSEIEQRHFAISHENFDPQAGVGELHQIFAENAPILAASAARKALQDADVSVDEIDQVVVATCTGYLCPGLSVHLMRDLDLPRSCQRADLVGMGCAGAMPALQRAHDYVRGLPHKTSLLVAVEICSACWFVDDSIETVVGNTICGDGAAALVVRGGNSGDSRHPKLLDFECRVSTDAMDSVGLENRDGRHRIVLSKEIRQAAGPLVKEVVDSILTKHSLKKEDISHWVFHAGGAAVLSNIDEWLDFDETKLRASRQVLRKHGNISSPTTLFVLKEIQDNHSPKAGELGIALALGPGVATEAALLTW